MIGHSLLVVRCLVMFSPLTPQVWGEEDVQSFPSPSLIQSTTVPLFKGGFRGDKDLGGNPITNN
jgi:hypothetical protein